MTTVLADFGLGLMAADSCVSDGDRAWAAQKIFRHKGHILGFAGEENQWIPFLAWWKGGCEGKEPKFSDSSALVMSIDGLVAFNNACVAVPMKSGIAAIGSGGKGAMCAYEALGHKDPSKAVAIACKYDLASRKPVRTYRL